MFKQIIRSISTFLVVVMLFNMLPMQSFADLHLDSTDQIEITPAGSASKEVAIVQEITENRSEYSKEFLLSNGLHMATVYAEPVHYEKDGKWADIDNTLVTHTDGMYKNTAGVWEVSFPQSFGSNQSISVTKDGYTLSFGMPQKLTTGGNSGAVVMSTESTAETFAVSQATTVNAQIDSKAELLAAKAEAEHPETVLDKLSSRLTYANVHSNTNVVYDLDSNRVKESIVLAKPDDTLRGYRYTLNVGTMIPVLQDDGSIIFYAPDEETVVMVMPAPYLQDNVFEISTDVSVTLTGKGSQYVLTYTLPQEWLASEDRQWPVILDPVIEADLDVDNIIDAVIASKHTYSYTNPILDIGLGSSYGIKRSFLKYENLPQLTSADVIVSATLKMYQVVYRTISIPAEVHKVTGDWHSTTITWANQPGYDPIVEDFVMGHSKVDYKWDVTEIVQDWYRTGVNNGMMFKAPESVETGTVEKFRQFASSEYNVSNRPALNITFRNNNGLEGWWDYSSASAGRAGTGYVNTYTGNLVWTRSDMGFGGNLMPVTLGYTYNTNDAANNSFGMGYGWRSDFNQLLYRWDEDGDGTIQSDEKYYIWEDGDGTSHYFRYSNEKNAIINADGLEMTLTTYSSGDSRYILTDKTGNTWHFDSQGRLYKIENYQNDSSYITVTYKDATSKLISTVLDGAGRKYLFDYGNDTVLDSVAFYGTGTDALTTVTYSYTNENLTGVQYKDGKSASYTYTGSHLLKTAKDIDGYQLTYNYAIENSEFAPPCIESVTETDLTEENTTVEGGKLFFQYNHNQTMLQSSYKDENDEEQIESKLYYQFNNYGNVVAMQDDEGRAQYADFYSNDPNNSTEKGNQLKLSSKLQNTVINLLSDSSFEASTNWIAATSDVCSISTTEHYLGSQSLKVINGNAFSQLFTAKAGETYTFSGYVKVISGTAELCMITPDGQHYALSTPASNSEWARIQINYTNTTSSDQQVYAAIRARGTSYLDCVQVEQMPTASRYNLVNNSDFASSDGWTLTNLVSGTDVITTAPETSPALDSNAYKITGEHTTAKSVKQTITVSGGDGDSYVFGGWAMGQSASLEEFENGVTKDFSIKCTIYNGTEVVKEEKVQFNPNVTQWQFVSDAIAATGDYTSITIEAVFSNNANTVYFDGLQLFKEEFGTSYTYDDDGNVISVVDLQNKNTTYEYAGNNLTKIIQDGKEKMSYTYDEWHNVETATTEEGYVYKFEYDIYGNNTKVSITSGTQTISSEAKYKYEGNLLDYTTDELGNKTYYEYDEDTGLLEWVQYPEDTAATKTQYGYDEMYNMETITAQLYRGETDTNLDMSVEYAYADDRLSAITTPTTTYSFGYGDFSLRESVSVGTRTLTEYTYETGTNRKQSLDYGNGDSVQYKYDDYGRLTQKKYEDNETVTCAYDNSGNIATVTDSETGIVTTYYYDLLNRNVGYREQGPNLDHSVTYIYDADNNLSSMTEVINGTSKTYTYTYNEDNRLTSMTVDGVTVEYTYDTFGRLSRQVTKQDNTIIRTEQIGYNDTATTASAQVTSHNGLTYTYDDNGNILSISDGTNTTSYVYDSQNQLIRENNQAKNFTKVWTYDNAGNIQSRTEYDYTTAEDLSTLTPNDTVSYEYNDDKGWGDLLTSYDGREFEYDTIGNLTNDQEWTYSWKNGRQLVSMSDGTTTWNYTYNADNLRTKRTNGTYTYSYVYSGSQLAMMSKGNDTLYFTYDASGVPLAVKYNGTTYYYKTNLQGDIIAIVDGTGTEVVNYAYDAWGVLLAISGTMKDTLGTVNPLTYRGYVYDRETGLYYLQSRYYDPELGRFINADNRLSDVGGEILGYNMFAYCMNNPVNGSDPTGNWAKWFETTVKVVSAVVLVAAVAVTVAAVSAYTAGSATPLAVYGATVLLGAALSGINGGIANEAKGNSYFNGYIGGSFGGATQAAASRFPGGTVWGGGLGTGTGTGITMGLNNLDPYSSDSSLSEIKDAVVDSTTKATATSLITASIGAGVGGIDYKTGTLYGGVADGCGGLMPSLTLGFGEAVKAFFGWLDDAFVYIWE